MPTPEQVATRLGVGAKHPAKLRAFLQEEGFIKRVVPAGAAKRARSRSLRNSQFHQKRVLYPDRKIVAQSTIESVFLNIPYDTGFEDLYLAYVAGLTMLGLAVNVTLALPSNATRLDKIIGLIQTSTYSIHDLSRMKSLDGVSWFDMPLELGLALYRAKTDRRKHTIYIFE